jgi:hypothetical protein
MNSVHNDSQDDSVSNLKISIAQSLPERCGLNRIPFLLCLRDGCDELVARRQGTGSTLGGNRGRHRSDNEPSRDDRKETANTTLLTPWGIGYDGRKRWRRTHPG